MRVHDGIVTYRTGTPGIRMFYTGVAKLANAALSKCVGFDHPCGFDSHLRYQIHGPVAQRIRVSAFEAFGRRFESYRGRQCDSDV